MVGSGVARVPQADRTTVKMMMNAHCAKIFFRFNIKNLHESVIINVIVPNYYAVEFNKVPVDDVIQQRFEI